MSQRATPLAVLALAVALGSTPAVADELPEPRRLAVVVGAKAGALGRGPLQYAHRDAQELASTLRAVAHFRAEDIQLLLEPTPAAVLSALDRARAMASAERDGALLLFYYSGHADDRSLYPSGQRLDFSELRARLDGGATVRIGIIDACRGGGWTGAKGLSETEPFEVRLPMTLDSEGSILLASSSGDENAHEAEAIGGSIFTHHFVAGLRGAADGNADGEVTVAEAFGYARELTIRDSVVLTSHQQNPSFSFNVRGRVDLPLARPAVSPVTVSVRQQKGPLSILDRSSGRSMLELPPGKRTVEVALPPGRYLALRKSGTQVKAREFTLATTDRFILEEGSLADAPQLASSSKGAALGPRHTLTVSPLDAPGAVLHFELERALSRHFSLYAGPWLGLPFNERGLWSAQLDLGVRFFLLGNAPSGLFAAGQAGLGTTFTRPGSYGDLLIAVELGYSAILFDLVVLSISAGPHYRMGVWNTQGPETPAEAQLFPRVRGMLGVAF